MGVEVDMSKASNRGDWKYLRQCSGAWDSQTILAGSKTSVLRQFIVLCSSTLDQQALLNLKRASVKVSYKST